MVQSLKTADRHGRLELPLSFIIWTLIFSVVTIIFVYACGMMTVEVGKEGANVKGFGDALWLGVMVISTVGFGDHYATTTLGRFLTVFMVMSGPIVLGAFFAVGQALIKTDANITNRELMSVVMELHRQIDELHAKHIGPTIVNKDSHGLDRLIETREWGNLLYSGHISLGADNMNIYKISFHAASTNGQRTDLMRHVYAGDNYTYAKHLFDFYTNNQNIY